MGVEHRHLPGIVAIGRNEGLRLQRCLESLARCSALIVYVDSGSTDGSRERARAFGARVVELDLSQPFTAARARNAGFARLLQEAADVEFVQFIDGDCTLRPDWIETGVRLLREQRDLAVVCGRRRERAPEDSIYNRLCDIEWDTPVGEARACGGDALMRVDAFRRVGGYDPALIAGEEPELCLRLTRRGYRIVRHAAEMTLHDAAMSRWTQWWQRAVRTGHTTAELLALHGITPEHQRLRRGLSAFVWAFLVPLAWMLLFARALAAPFSAGALLVCLLPLVAYATLVLRVRRRCLRAGRSPADATAYALSCVCAKWPELWGMLLFASRRLAGRSARWIEYKDGPRGVAQPARARAPARRRARGSRR